MNVEVAASHLVLASTASEAGSKIVDVVAVVAGFVAILLVIFIIAERATGRLQRPLALVVCVAPAVILSMAGLVIPAINTTWLSLTSTQATGQKFKLINGKLVANHDHFVGLSNYKYAFTDSYTQRTLINTVLWIVIVPAVTVFLGLMMALLLDRMKHTSVAKTLIFLPTAISFVGAAIIWLQIYDQPVFQGDGRPGAQTGLLSQLAISLGAKHPPNWLLNPPSNTFLLMVILIWIEVGFAMVVLGAALKAIPDEVIEAAKVDGATGLRLFTKVQIPMIRSTLIVVITTVTIITLKIFDIIFTLTNGNFKTDVLANQMYNQLFVTNQTGRGAALAVLLFLCVIPLVMYNIRQIRRERAIT